MLLYEYLFWNIFNSFLTWISYNYIEILIQLKNKKLYAAIKRVPITYYGSIIEYGQTCNHDKIRSGLMGGELITYRCNLKNLYT